MSLQRIDDKVVYVVQFDTMPELPITGLTAEETTYRKLCLQAGWAIGLPFGDNGLKYSEALTHAIETGVITEPGKYAIALVPGKNGGYVIYTIQEPV